MVSPNLALYQRFMHAMMAGDDAAVRACVDVEKFAISIPGRNRLTFDEALMHFAHLRNMAPDFGNRITLQTVIEEGCRLAVKYYMVFTVGGKPIGVTSIDMVTIHGGLVVEVQVIFDRQETMQQISAG